MARHLGVILAEQKATDTIPFGFVYPVNSQTTQSQKASPKRDFAVAWLRDHSECKDMTLRELESSVLMNGNKISFKYWAEAKKLV